MLSKSTYLFFMLLFFSVTACFDKNTDEKIINVEVSAESIKEKWGVDEFSVHETSAGYMLDIRYRVTDTTKAKPLFERKLRPFVVEEDSGIRYGVPASPKVGYLRQTSSNLKKNKIYFLMIANPGKRIKKGNKITLIIGDFKIEHLIVE